MDKYKIKHMLYNPEISEEYEKHIFQIFDKMPKTANVQGWTI